MQKEKSLIDSIQPIKRFLIYFLPSLAAALLYPYLRKNEILSSILMGTQKSVFFIITIAALFLTIGLALVYLAVRTIYQRTWWSIFALLFMASAGYGFLTIVVVIIQKLWPG